MSDDRTDDRIREIDRRVAELDILLGKFRNTLVQRTAENPNFLSADEMIHWADHRLERNTLLAERYRLTKKSA